MNNSNNDISSKHKRAQIIEQTKIMIESSFKYVIKDDDTITTDYKDFILQIHFSNVHPLVIITLLKTFDHEIGCGQVCVINELNLHSILGCHVVNTKMPSYCYRATHWLETPMSREMFFTILVRCSEEAREGYSKLSGSIEEERRRVNEEM